MKRVQLEIEHSYKKRYLGRHTLKSSGPACIMGSSREADIRLLGDEVNGVHAILEFDKGNWVLSDMKSQQGTWVKKKPIMTLDVTNIVQVRIGGHELKLIPREIQTDLFHEEANDSAKKEGQAFHQVVICKENFVIESILLEENELFSYYYNGQFVNLNAPKSTQWIKNQYENIHIRQRLVYTHPIEERAKDRLLFLWDTELRTPMSLVLIFLLLIFSLIALVPEKPEDEMKELQPDKNKYTRIIYDAQSARKKRKKALRQKSSITNKQKVIRKVAELEKVLKATNKSNKKSTPKVVTKIRVAGLSQLVGKISKRAAKNLKLIQVIDKPVDSRAARKALVSAGSLNVGKKNIGSSTFKIKGVGTTGKARGNSSFGGVSRLSASGVGSASIGVLEEETDIQGGLNRSVISRVIQSHLGQIRYCYERQLSANPDLYGKVMVKFTIGGSGAVIAQNVGLTTLSSTMVEGCILRRIASWKFPRPEGGTQVFVTYPFLFKSTN